MSRVLVVVDMQNDFIDGSLGTKEAQLIVQNVVEKINNFDGDIYVTLDTHEENYLETQEGRSLPIKHCISGTRGHELNSDILRAINNKSSSYFFEKLTFGSVELADALDYKNTIEKPIDVIEIIGLCTDICVISNAILIKAYIPEVKITVDASCCAGVTPDTHKKALESMKVCQINIINE